jgi:hypothetical protein
VRTALAGLRDAALDGAGLDVQRTILIDGLLAHGISADTIPAIMERVRDGVVLAELSDASSPCRIGGPPELPPGAVWPCDLDGEPLTFIARFALGGLPALEPLPADGTLLVYWSERCFEWDRMDFRVATRVFWVPASETPVAATAPRGVPSYAAVPLTGVLMPVLGELEHVTIPEGDAEAFYDAVDELTAAYDHQLLGASRDVQGPVLDEIAYWLHEGFPETRADFSAPELAGEGWVLLAQIDSTGELMFGDAGALYLVMPRCDLDACRFDRVLGIMQCH